MFGFDDSYRHKVLLELRKAVKAGDLNPPKPGDIFTHSFNLATGDRSYMNCIWQVVACTPQQVYAECVMNVEKDESVEPSVLFNYVGKRHMFDMAEHQFYNASHLFNAISEERAAKRANAPSDNPNVIDLSTHPKNG